MNASNPTPLLLSDREYERWSSLLEQRAGLRFATQRSRLQTGLRQRMRILEARSLDAYYHHVSSDSAAARAEWHHLLDGLTVRDTRFFRDPAALALAAEHAQARLTEPEATTLSLLSAGCASGEEPWSLALVLRQVLGDQAARERVCIQALDISSVALAQARTGCYAARRIQDMPLQHRTFFDRRPNGDYAIQQQRLPAVQFHQHNLQQALPGRYDIVICQNVLIYFQAVRRLEVLRHLVAALKPGGLLITAPGEVGYAQDIGLQRYPHPAVQAWVRSKTH